MFPRLNVAKEAGEDEVEAPEVDEDVAVDEAGEGNDTVEVDVAAEVAVALFCKLQIAT